MIHNRFIQFIKNYLLSRRAYHFFIRDWVALTDIKQAADMMATMRFSRNLQPQCRAGTSAKRILVIAPHPDDEILGPGGTILKDIAKGAQVVVVYLTSGAQAEMKRRQQEAQDVASQVGYQTIFFDYYPQSIPIDEESMQRLSTVINDFLPEVLFLPFCLDDHDDHRRASHLLLEICRGKLLACSFEIWAYQVYTTLLPNVIVDISDVAETKRKMAGLWESQANKRNWAHFALGLNAFNQRFLPPDSRPRYAETFFVLPLKDYIDYCSRYFDFNTMDCYYSEQYKNSTCSTTAQ